MKKNYAQYALGLVVLVLLPWSYGWDILARVPVFMIGVLAMSIALKHGQGALAFGHLAIIILLNPFFPFDWSVNQLAALYLFILFVYLMMIFTRPAEKNDEKDILIKIINALGAIVDFCEKKQKEMDVKHSIKLQEKSKKSVEKKRK